MKPPQPGVCFTTLFLLVCVAGTCLQTADAAGLRLTHRGRQSLIEDELANAKTLKVASSYNAETPVVILGRQLPLSAEAFFAGLFVCLIASVPVILARLEDRITKTHLIQFAVLLSWLVTFLYLFTQVVEFESVHFVGRRPLTLVETIYLMAQVLTTVGHGDISPASAGGQFVVGVYVLFTIVLIADMVSAVVNLAVLSAKGSHFEKISSQRLVKDTPGTLKHPGGLHLRLPRLRLQNNDWMKREAPTLPWQKLFSKFAGFCFFVISGTFFYHYCPGEDKTWTQGVYMSVITLSTVGFGAVLPSTEAGKVFGAFWMLFGVASLLNLVGGFTEFMLVVKVREQWNETEEQAELLNLQLKAKTHKSEAVDKYDFLWFALLHAKILRREDLEQIEKTFNSLGPDTDGCVPFKMIEDAAIAAHKC